MEAAVVIERAPTLTADELYQLYRSVGWGAYLRDPEMLPAAVAGSSYVVAARRDGRLVGLARVITDGVSICYLQDVLVEPGLHRTGIGRLLVTAVLEPYGAVRQKVLLTDAQPGQRRFYEGLGFQEAHDVAAGPLRAFVRVDRQDASSDSWRQPRSVDRPPPDSIPALLEDDSGEPPLFGPPPHVPPVRNFPTAVVLCFFGEVVGALATRPDARLLTTLTSVQGVYPIWKVDVDGHPVAVIQPLLGAPATVAVLEELIALGGRRFVAVGGAGALLPDLALGHAIIVSSAVRDEGTSFHYLPPSRTVDADPAGVDVLRGVLTAARVPHVVARTWTTDAIYRETRTRIERRVGEDCATVEMEAAGLIAAAGHHQVGFAQLLYAGDSLAGDEWDHRDWTAATVRQPLFDLAAQAAVTWCAINATG